jgi:hypothetical protein
VHTKEAPANKTGSGANNWCTDQSKEGCECEIDRHLVACVCHGDTCDETFASKAPTKTAPLSNLTAVVLVLIATLIHFLKLIYLIGPHCIHLLASVTFLRFPNVTAH